MCTEYSDKDRELTLMVVCHYTKMLHLKKILSADVKYLESESYGGGDMLAGDPPCLAT